MHVHPDIAALRTDRGPQRQAQRAMQLACEAWRADPGAAAMLAELEAFGAGTPLEDCPALDQVFTGADEAERLTGLLSQHFCAAIAANPYGHPPFRNGFDGRAASLLLGRAGRAQLIIQAREPGEYGAENRIFNDSLRFDAVLGGLGAARIVRMVPREDGGGDYSEERLALKPGCRLALDLASETLLVDRVERRLVILRLLRTNADPQPSREYCAESGALLHQSAADLGTSRQEAIIALLGRMGRQDAAPAMRDVALGKGDASLRWQALREALALDTALGFATLLELARRTGDPLADPAGALRAQLIETYPQLLQLEDAQCPA